jgi:hypothetical protein
VSQELLGTGPAKAQPSKKKRRHLTDAEVRDIQPTPGKQIDYFDSEMPGLVLRVSFGTPFTTSTPSRDISSSGGTRC